MGDVVRLVGYLLAGIVGMILTFLQGWPVPAFLFALVGSWCSLQYDDVYRAARQRRIEPVVPSPQ